MSEEIRWAKLALKVSEGMLHPRNRHTGYYDFTQLVQATPELAPFVSQSPRGDPTIDFADAVAVKLLNAALLKCFYGIVKWDFPEGYLCPPIPGRSDYIHTIADLLAELNGGEVPRGDQVRVLDIGVGANCIYPIVGHCEYGWSFVGTEVDPIALASAQKIAQANSSLLGALELRLQRSPGNIFKGIISGDESFGITICNPPFHASQAEAEAGSRRKWDNLGRTQGPTPKLNFGGQGGELWCAGGESAFVTRMIEESVSYARSATWFSTLISRDERLPALYAVVERVGAAECRTLEMAQGQKKSRILAWSFLD